MLRWFETRIDAFPDGISEGHAKSTPTAGRYSTALIFSITGKRSGNSA